MHEKKDIVKNKMFKVIWSKVKVNLIISGKKSFGYNFCIICLIGTKVVVRLDIGKEYNLVEGQCHWVKGQGQILDFLKNYF